MEKLEPIPLVSVIIVNYNTTVLTFACIRSVLKFTSISFELILVDNASTDRSIENLPTEFKQVKLILNKKNLGFGAANNLGIAIAKGKYILLLNSDTLFNSDAITAFFNFMENPKHGKIAGCGGSLIALDGSKQVSYGNFPSLFEVFSTLGPGIFYKNYYRKHLSAGVKVYHEKPHRVDYVSGANFFIRKTALTETGLFDEDFFLYFEETELAFRMQKKGYELYILPQVAIIHLERGSPYKGGALAKEKIFNVSRLLFFKKCHGSFVAYIAQFLYFLQKLIYKLKPKQAI